MRVSSNHQGQVGPVKKLKIKPLKLKPRLPSDFVDKTWLKLKSAIEAVFSQTKVSYSFEDLYRSAEDLCLHKKAELVYQKLKQQCELQVRRKKSTSDFSIDFL